MAQHKIRPEQGRFKLGGSKDADLEGIDDKKYDVFTETEKLEKARNDFPMYDWFVSYVIKDKDGHEVRNLPEYTMKIEPRQGFERESPGPCRHWRVLKL